MHIKEGIIPIVCQPLNTMYLTIKDLPWENC
jgi:hypothetical protein